MLSLRRIILLVVALTAAVGTGIYAKSWLAAERLRAKEAAEAGRGAAVAAKPQVQVLVAAKRLSAGAFVKREDLRWQPWPADGLSESYHVKGTENGGASPDLVGAVVRQSLDAGQPITAQAVVRAGERGFLAAVLRPGTRAVSVPVNATTGIAGFVFPGDRVDVILALRTRGKDEEGKGETRHLSATLLEGVRVLAVDQAVEKARGEAAPAKTATLEVSPKEAEKVALALEMGSLSLSLNSLVSDALAVEIPMEPAGEGDGDATVTLDAELFNAKGRLDQGGRGGGGVVVLRASKAERTSF